MNTEIEEKIKTLCTTEITSVRIWCNVQDSSFPQHYDNNFNSSWHNNALYSWKSNHFLLIFTHMHKNCCSASRILFSSKKSLTRTSPAKLLFQLHTQFMFYTKIQFRVFGLGFCVTMKSLQR